MKTSVNIKMDVEDRDAAKKILFEKEIGIEIELHDGNYSSVGWGCDLTYEYVHINGDYRS